MRMSIHGTGKADKLAGTIGTDAIAGGNGDDFLDGGAGNDALTGGAGSDKFVLRAGGGNDVVTDFNAAAGDRVLFDYGSYSDVLYLGPLHDGLAFDNFIGTAHFTVSAVDVNHDGLTDTLITANDDSIALLGVDPASLWGWALMGG